MKGNIERWLKLLLPSIPSDHKLGSLELEKEWDAGSIELYVISNAPLALLDQAWKNWRDLEV